MIDHLRVRGAALACGGVLAMAGGAAFGQTTPASTDRLRTFENPPVATVADAQPSQPNAAPSVKALRDQGPLPVAKPDPRETIAYSLTIGMATAPIYNPWTRSYDNVALRSYFQGGADAAAPLHAPTVTMRPGQTVRMSLDNQLPPDIDCDQGQWWNVPHCFNRTNLHSHGLWVSPTGNSDNVLISIAPQTKFTYEYNVPDDHPAGTFWYHPHKHGSTAIQVSSGMGGALIIKAQRKPTPTTPGDLDILLPFTERVLLFQQVQYACFDKDGNIQTAHDKKGKAIAPWTCDPGQVGELRDYRQFGPGNQWATSGRFTLINGRVQPEITGLKAGRFERWRMIHAGVRETVNVRVYPLNPKGGDFRDVPAAEQAAWMARYCAAPGVDALPTWEVALDGLTRSEVRTSDASRLQPGYRIDAVTYFPKAGQYCLIDDKSTQGLLAQAEDRRLLGVATVDPGDPPAPDPAAALRTRMLAAAASQLTGEVLARVTGDLNDGMKLGAFVWHAPVADSELVGSQPQFLAFNIDIKNSPTGEGGIAPDTFQVANAPIVPGRPGLPYSPDRIDRLLPLGGVQEWTLTSDLANHPFHIHVNPFQVVSVRAGGVDVSATDPDYAGLLGQWKDTLFVKAGYEIKVRTRYERYIGDFVLHCHILDHEDQGMMQNVRVWIPDGQGGVASAHH
jgi:L-ascorbate oxidase